jgi:hypothetical protein
LWNSIGGLQAMQLNSQSENSGGILIACCYPINSSSKHNFEQEVTEITENERMEHWNNGIVKRWEHQDRPKIILLIPVG